MGKDTPAAPAPVDYKGAAEQTSAGNLALAQYTTSANRVNQYTPYGSQTYSNSPTFDQKGYDSAMADYMATGQTGSMGTWVPGTEGSYSGGEGQSYTPGTEGHWDGANAGIKPTGNAPDRNTYMRDNWTQTTNLTPDAQAALDSQLAITKGKSDQANSMLQGVTDSYDKPFDPTKLADYLSGIEGVNVDDLGKAAGFSTSAEFLKQLGNVGQVNTSALTQNGQFNGNTAVDGNTAAATAGAQGLNQNFGRLNDGGQGVNTSAPEYSQGRQDQYSKAAYDAQMALLQPGMDSAETRRRNQLALQGLGSGSEANDNAMGEFNTGRTQQLNNLAAQSVLTGNQMSNADYSQQLAGFQAGNAAEGQRFGQASSAFNTNVNAGQAENAARSQTFAQGLQALQARNAASGQQFAQNQGTFNTNMSGNMANAQLQQMGNQAQQQQFDQGLQSAQFANQGNASQLLLDQSKYDNSLKSLQTNAALQAQGNQAQAQQYGQGLQNYATQWQQDQTLRNMPLNELNALLTGAQVQNPTFTNYALQGQTSGADYADAAAKQGQADQGIWNSQAAAAAQGNQATASGIGAIAGAAMMFY